MDHHNITYSCIQLILLLVFCLAIPLPYLPASSYNLQLVSAARAASTPSTSVPIFIFGASMVDAGQNAVAMPRRSNADFHPYGSDYFGKPVGRWSNGRIFMDFITEALEYGHVPSYLRSIGSDFSYGVNFASSGSTAANSSTVGKSSGGLFCLLVQIDQFRDYQDAVMSSHHGPKEKTSIRQQFSDAIYFFETAYNDYYRAVYQSDASFDLNTTVIATILAMKTAFQSMYGLGARTFVIMNVTPVGCSPVVLSNTDDEEELDENNCNAKWMNIVQTHNERLNELLDELREDYPAAEWILFDAYSIFLDGYLNPSKYGVKYPFQACCGAGGTYNVNVKVQCGMDAQYINGTLVEWTKCEDPKLHLIWDTMHPVESFAYYIAQGVLNGTHLVPSYNVKERVQSLRMVINELRED